MGFNRTCSAFTVAEMFSWTVARPTSIMVNSSGSLRDPIYSIGLYEGYIGGYMGLMEKKMESTILYRVTLFEVPGKPPDVAFVMREGSFSPHLPNYHYQ